MPRHTTHEVLPTPKTESTILLLQTLEKRLKIDPYYAEAYCNLGIVYDSKGEYDRAIENYSQAIQLKHDYAVAYNNRGITYGKNGESDLAIIRF